MNNMKHIENFDKFNESWLGDKLKKWFPESEERKIYNEIASHTFERIKETFEMENLSGTTSELKYNLEETDSDLGYIKIRYSDGGDEYDDVFTIDDREIDCSDKLKNNIYKFLYKKLKEKEKAERLKDLLEFKDKYTR